MSQAATTVQVKVQVVDLQSKNLHLQVPTYLPAKDLTQRVARDAGLPDYWEDGSRRLYWLRARGRVLGANETLGDLGVVRGELVHLLPVPLDVTQVREQHPDYPEERGYFAKGKVALAVNIVVVLVWAVGWGIALGARRSAGVVLLPGLAMGLFSVSLARHLFGGQGWRSRVAATGIPIAVAGTALASMVALFSGVAPGEFIQQAAPGLVAAFVGVLFGWLAWWGAVEPLKKLPKPIEQVEEESEDPACHLCGLGVQLDVRMSCPYGCGKQFHTGCHRACKAVYRGDRAMCEVCGVRVQAADA